MDECRYVSAGGKLLTGTLIEIGKAIIAWRGDNAARDNVEPWLHFDDDGSVWRREFTTAEWVEWASRADHRPIGRVLRTLSLLASMSPAGLRCRREALGLSQWAPGEALAILQVDIYRMELGSQPIPQILGC
jgi:hypothetical protein